MAFGTKAPRGRRAFLGVGPSSTARGVDTHLASPASRVGHRPTHPSNPSTHPAASPRAPLGGGSATSLPGRPFLSLSPAGPPSRAGLYPGPPPRGTTRVRTGQLPARLPEPPPAQPQRAPPARSSPWWKPTGTSPSQHGPTSLSSWPGRARGQLPQVWAGHFLQFVYVPVAGTARHLSETPDHGPAQL